MKIKIVFLLLMTMQLVASEAEQQSLTSRTEESLKKFLQDREYQGVRSDGKFVGGLKPLAQIITNEHWMQSINGNVYCGFSTTDAYLQMVLSYHTIITFMQIEKLPDQDSMNMSPVIQEYRRKWSKEYPLDVKDLDLQNDQNLADIGFLQHAKTEGEVSKTEILRSFRAARKTKR